MNSPASLSETRNHPCSSIAGSNEAFLPCPSQDSIPLAASIAAVPAAASASVVSCSGKSSESSQQLRPVEDYPSSVQELVMNGFSLRAVVNAFDLVGNNFDDMLSLLLANNTVS